VWREEELLEALAPLGFGKRREPIRTHDTEQKTGETVVSHAKKCFPPECKLALAPGHIERRKIVQGAVADERRDSS
jgi:hypothetical protein